MPRPEPMDLDDEDDQRQPRRRRSQDGDEDDPPPRVPALLPLPLLRPAWVLAAMAGGFAVFTALGQAAPWAAAFSGIGCFCGIVARLIQAEETRLFAEEREKWRARQARRNTNNS